MTKINATCYKDRCMVASFRKYIIKAHFTSSCCQVHTSYYYLIKLSKERDVWERISFMEAEEC